MSRVILKPRKARPFYGRHPWVLDSAIDRIDGNPADGDVVDLWSDQECFIARGVFNSRSRIHVRLYTWNESESLDDSFWRRRLESALALRVLLGYDIRESAARLVFSEADGLSGLIVDRYGEFLVVQVTALALAVRLPQIVPMLVELTQPQGILLRSERDIVRAEGLNLPPGLPWGAMPEGPLEILDQGLCYAVDLAEGQKTGLYLDQRENRTAAARYMTGRRVLDMFCYTGGFSLAAAAQARRVVLVEDDEMISVETYEAVECAHPEIAVAGLDHGNDGASRQFFLVVPRVHDERRARRVRRAAHRRTGE